MTPFLLCGVIISKILSTSPERAGRLYAADLIGASLGCMTCIPLLVLLDPPRTIILAGLIFTIGALRLSLRSRPLFIMTAALVLVLIPFLAMERLLPEPSVDTGKTSGKTFKADFSKWHPVFRVDVMEGKSYFKFLVHDGQAGSALWRFDGDFSLLPSFNKSSRVLPFQVLPERPKVLIIGSAGGVEILTSLYFNASHVTGVELNPVTVSLLTDKFSDYTGRLAEDSRVSLINGEGRWFMKQSDATYDLIWFVAPDSYAAMNASSAAGFVLVESYLYTVEMLRESLRHLTENGIICAQFGECDYDLKPNAQHPATGNLSCS